MPGHPIQLFEGGDEGAQPERKPDWNYAGARANADRLSPTSAGSSRRPRDRHRPVPAPSTGGARRRCTADARSPQARLEEAVGLAPRDRSRSRRGRASSRLTEIRPATFIGKGKVDEIAGLVKTHAAGLVVMDCALSPVQQRNLEKGLGRQGARPHRADPGNLRPAGADPGRRAAGRARASELPEEPAGALLDPSRAAARRLRIPRRPGRDADRIRPARDRRAHLARIERELDKVKSTAQLHRESRKRVPYPIVALVGYTNAGKSTLFNRLTRRAGARSRHVVRHARSDAARASNCRTAPRRSCPTPSASSPICRPCWSRRSAPRWKR